MKIPAIRAAVIASRALAGFLTGGLTFSLASAAFAAPSITISSPGANSHLSTLTAFTGTASDTGGIQKVTVNIVGYANDSTGFLYWNGTSWQANASNYDATLSTPVNDQVTWNWPSNVALPGTNFSPGRYLVRATAYNNVNATTGATNTIYSGTDSTAPSASFSTPQNNETMEALSYPTGSATDAGGIRRVRFSLQRIGESGNVYWTGSAWSTASTLFTGAVTPTDANDADRTSITWTGASMTLPSGTDVPAARYIWTFQVFDRAENVTTVTRTVYVLPEDHVNPVAALSSPAPNSVQTAWTGGVSGTASDPEDAPGVPGSGVVRVTVLLYRSTSGGTEYFNNGTWGAGQTLTYATLGTPDGDGVSAWSATIPGLAAGDLPSGKYFIRVQAYDRYNNGASTSPAFYVSPEDHVPPTASVTAPASGASVSRLTSLAGTAADDAGGSGLARVQIQLSHMFPNGTGTVKKYWTGSAWSTTATMLATLTPTTANWSITNNLPGGATNLPAGTYTVKAYPYDRYENQGTTASSDFNVVANTAPVSSGKSVSTPFETDVPITVTATDAEGDAITYLLVASPAHGTLAGSLPNLTYTPGTGFNGDDSFTFKAQDYALTGNTATVTIHVTSVPYVDALAKAAADGAYTGDDIVSTDGTGETVTQTVVADGKATYHLAIQKVSEEASMTVKVTAVAPDTGWTVKYFKGLTGVEEITGQVTGATGWPVTLGESDSYLRVEVTRSGSVAVPVTLDLLVTVRTEDDPPHVDAVKLVTTANPSLQPDISFKEPPATSWIGTGIYSPDATVQNLPIYSIGPARTVQIQLKNAGTATADYRLSGLSSQDTWSAKYYDTTDGADITAAVADGSWQVSLQPGQSRLLRMEIAALDMSTGPGTAFPFVVSAGQVVGGAWQANSWVDSGSVKVAAQTLAGLEYSLDQGDSWHTFTGQLTVPRLTVVGFRGVKTIPGADWRYAPYYQPRWSYQGSRGCGETVWIQYKTVGQESVAASCGNTVSGTVTVVGGP